MADLTSLFEDRALRGGALVALFLGLAIPSAWKAGIVTDEIFYLKAAKLYGYYAYEAVASLDPFDPELYSIWIYNSEHPPLLKFVSSISWGAVVLLRGGNIPMEVSVFAHRLGPIALSAAAVFILHQFVSETHGRWAGVAAALALIATPRWFAHARFAELDAPMAALWLATAWACWKGWRDERWAVVAGVTFGLALATKLNAFFIPIAIGLWAVLAHGRTWLARLREEGRPSLREVLETPPGRLVAACALIGPLIFFAIWPWMWFDTAQRVVDYLIAHLTHFPIPTYYFGETYWWAPWHYPLVMTAITLPIPVMAFALVGGVSGLRDEDRRRRNATLFFAVNALVPIAALMSPSTPKYDGVRLFLPAMPFLAALAGVGLQRALTWWQDRSEPDRRTRRALGAAGLIVLAAPGLVAYAQLDPYEEIYYNQLIGGPDGAFEQGFTIAYWAPGTHEAVDWLNDEADATNRLAVDERRRPLQVYAAGDVGWAAEELPEGHAFPDWIDQEPGLEENVTLAPREEATHDVLHTRQGRFSDEAWRLFREAEPAFRLEQGGVPLVQVYER